MLPLSSPPVQLSRPSDPLPLTLLAFALSDGGAYVAALPTAPAAAW